MAIVTTDTQDTSCSDERPPNITARFFFMVFAFLYVMVLFRNLRGSNLFSELDDNTKFYADALSLRETHNGTKFAAPAR